MPPAGAPRTPGYPDPDDGRASSLYLNLLISNIIPTSAGRRVNISPPLLSLRWPFRLCIYIYTKSKPRDPAAPPLAPSPFLSPFELRTPHTHHTAMHTAHRTPPGFLSPSQQRLQRAKTQGLVSSTCLGCHHLLRCWVALAPYCSSLSFSGARDPLNTPETIGVSATVGAKRIGDAAL